MQVSIVAKLRAFQLSASQQAQGSERYMRSGSPLVEIYFHEIAVLCACVSLAQPYLTVQAALESMLSTSTIILDSATCLRFSITPDIKRSLCFSLITSLEMAMQAGRQRIPGSIWHQAKRVLHNGWTLSKKLVKQVWDWIQRLAANDYFLLAADFFAAVAFAITHHLYYDRLAGTPPPSGDSQLYGPLQQFSGQSVNVAIGTLFATLVATLLKGCIETSHEQLSWKAARAKPAELALLDSLFSRSLWPPRLWIHRRYLGPEILVLLRLYVY
jgi:hypothetical protein